MEKKRKKETKVVDGVKWVRYDGDDLWVSEAQS